MTQSGADWHWTSMFPFSRRVHISADSAHIFRFPCTGRARQSRRPNRHHRRISCLQAPHLAVMSSSTHLHCSEIHETFSCRRFVSLEARLVRQWEGKRRCRSTPCDSWLFTSDTKRRLNCGKIMERLFIPENPKSRVNIWHNIDGVSPTSKKIAAMWCHTTHSETKTHTRTLERSEEVSTRHKMYRCGCHLILMEWIHFSDNLTFILIDNPTTAKKQQRFQNFSLSARCCRQNLVANTKKFLWNQIIQLSFMSRDDVPEAPCVVYIGRQKKNNACALIIRGKNVAKKIFVGD